MKNALILVFSPLFLIGVFGDEVSVKEGESVTLRTILTEIQSSDVIEWRFNGARLAKISSGSESFTTDVAFMDRLQLDKQTGDLKITNIKTTDSGEYKLKITSIRGSSEKTFSVNGVASADRDEVKSVSVKEGDSVTLNTKIQRDDVIWWRFGPQNSLVAEINRKTENVSTHDGPDGRFKDRLKADFLTGSLTIRNIGKNHSGVYEVDISRSRYTIHKTFSVTVSDKDAVKSVLVTEGESVTLNTSLTEIKTDDEILWKFRGNHIAEIIKADEKFHPYDGPDGRFRGRLKLDNQTGSLTITNTRFTDSGDYEVTISGSKYTVHKRISVTVTGSGSGSGLSAGAVAGIVAFLLVFGAAAAVIYHRRRTTELKSKMLRMQSVTEGASVPLIPLFRGIKILKDDRIQWRFGGALIAERGADGKITLHDGMFNGRLELDNVIGSLIIKDTKPTDSGPYELRVIRAGHESLNTFTVSVYDNGNNPEGMPLTDVNVS